MKVAWLNEHKKTKTEAIGRQDDFKEGFLIDLLVDKYGEKFRLLKVRRERSINRRECPLLAGRQPSHTTGLCCSV